MLITIQGYILYYQFDIIYCIVLSGIFGGLVFNFIPISFTQAIMRVKPEYLLTFTVLLNASGQLFSTLGTYIFGVICEQKTRESGLYCILLLDISYVVVFFINFLQPRFFEKDEKICQELYGDVEMKKGVTSHTSETVPITK